MWANATDEGRATGRFMTALILVVDDDPIQRRLLEAMMRRFGYDVETAETGEAGSRAWRRATARRSISSFSIW